MNDAQLLFAAQLISGQKAGELLDLLPEETWKGRGTLFDRITRSPEELAEMLVYAVHFGGLYFWHSTVIYPAIPFETKEAAIAATVAKLKEVCE